MNKYYLLFIIFLLQVSCKKNANLSSFDIMNEKMEDSNENLSNRNDALLEVIYRYADKKIDFTEKKENAKSVHQISKNFFNYISDLKTVIKKKNSSVFLDELFFNNGNITVEGQEFLNYIKNYKTSVISTMSLTYPEIEVIVNDAFNVSDIEDKRGKKTNWLSLNYKEFPPIASLIKLSKMQTDIKRIERRIYSKILDVKINRGNSTDTKNIANPKNTIKNKTQVKKEIKTKSVVVKKATSKKAIKASGLNDFHMVKKGETLYRIATKYKISTAKLKKMNGMTNNNLVVGQRLKVK